MFSYIMYCFHLVLYIIFVGSHPFLFLKDFCLRLIGRIAENEMIIRALIAYQILKREKAKFASQKQSGNLL